MPTPVDSTGESIEMSSLGWDPANTLLEPDPINTVNVQFQGLYEGDLVGGMLGYFTPFDVVAHEDHEFGFQEQLFDHIME